MRGSEIKGCGVISIKITGEKDIDNNSPAYKALAAYIRFTSGVVGT